MQHTQQVGSDIFLLKKSNIDVTINHNMTEFDCCTRSYENTFWIAIILDLLLARRNGSLLSLLRPHLHLAIHSPLEITLSILD